MKTTIRALILDYGGVISRPQNPDHVRNILRILGQDDDDFEKVYRGQRATYDNGELSGEEYWRNIFQHYGLKPNGPEIIDLIREDVNSWVQIDDSMVKFIEESREKLHKLAIISNMTRDTLAFISRTFQWLECFDELVFSCEIGINKPDIRIYEACLIRLGLSPKECLFVDDSRENVLGAMNTGMNGFHFKSFPHFKQESAEAYVFSR